MSDYIKKEDALSAVYDITTYKARIPLDTAVFRIKKIPSADVVEVVRCKDCKFNGAKNEDEGDCAMMEYKHNGDDYCSYGERK